MRAIFITILLLSPLLGMSQTVLFTGNPSMLTYHKGALGADSILKIPFADTTGVGSLWPDSLRKGAIMVNSADTMLYYHDGDAWRQVAGGSADTGFIRNQLLPTYIQEGNFLIDGVGAASRFFAADDLFSPSLYTNITNGHIVTHNAQTQGTTVIGANSLSEPSPMITTSGNLTAPARPVGANVTASWYNSSTVIFDSLDPNNRYVNAGILSHGRQFHAPGGTSSVRWSDISLYPVGIAPTSGTPDQVLHTPIEILARPTYPGMDVISLAMYNPGNETDTGICRNIYAYGAPNALLDKVLITDPQTGWELLPTANRANTLVGPPNDTFEGDWALKILGNIVYKNGDEGDGKILTSSADGTVNIVDAGSIIPDGAFVQDGNAFGETAVLGTTDNEALELIAGGNTALRVNPDATVQYTDGTEGDGKILMSSSDGTLSAQSRDSVMNGVWRSGIVNSMGTHATLRTSADTLTIINASGTPVMQSVGNRLAFNDIVRGVLDGVIFIGGAPSTGNFGTPILFEARFPSGAGGNRWGSLFKSIAANVTSIKNITVGRSRAATPIYIGIGDENWGAATATTNYFLHSGTFQPSSTNWFIFGEQNVKSQLAGNLLLGATSDNGHKLQVSGSIYGRNQSEPFNQFIMAESFTPTGTADASGEVGAMAWDDDYIYIKTSDGWKRSTLSTF